MALNPYRVESGNSGTSSAVLGWKDLANHRCASEFSLGMRRRRKSPIIAVVAVMQHVRAHRENGIVSDMAVSSSSSKAW